MRKFYAMTVVWAAICQMAFAQMPNDGLMMQKRQWCTLLQYTQSSWDEYWEGAGKRSNANLGTFTGQNIMLMTNYGISDRLNVMAGVPYVWTGSSDSYLQGQRGLQDLSVFLKYEIVKKALAGGEFKVQATGGASMPLTDYVPDFLPFSIGLQSKTASLRGILNFTHGSGLYITAQAGHSWRSRIEIDRDSYLYNYELQYTNEVPVPNVFDATGRLGFINRKVQAELNFDYFSGLSGDDIRYNDMPFPTNKMRAATAGIFAKYFIWKGLAVQAAAGKVLNGRNVGQSTTFSGGFTWFFTLGNSSE